MRDIIPRRNFGDLRPALLFNGKDSGTGIASGGGDFGGVHGSCGNQGIGEAGCSIGGGAVAIGGWDPAGLGADERAQVRTNNNRLI